jgi:hypothetical protein
VTEYKYFMIPSSAVPSKPSYKLWYATWTSASSTEVDSGATGPMAIGVTSDEVLPEGATLIATTSKDPPPPPLAPPPLAGDAFASYQREFASWLSTGRGFSL